MSQYRLLVAALRKLLFYRASTLALLLLLLLQIATYTFYTYFNNQLNAQILLFYNNIYVTLQSVLIRHTVQPFTESDDTRCCDNTICPPEDGHVNARNIDTVTITGYINDIPHL